MRTVSAYRTKCLPLTRAEAFARCLAARGQATDVQVLESNRTPNPQVRWFVYWTPRNVERQKALLQQSQDERQQRAEEQRHGYEFILSDCGRFHYCLSLKSGEVYETTVYGCDCPDATYNLTRTGLRCKHSLMLEMSLTEEAEELEIERQVQEGYEQAEREAHEQHLDELEREQQFLSSRADGQGGEYHRRYASDWGPFDN